MKTNLNSALLSVHEVIKSSFILHGIEGFIETVGDYLGEFIPSEDPYLLKEGETYEIKYFSDYLRGRLWETQELINALVKLNNAWAYYQELLQDSSVPDGIQPVTTQTLALKRVHKVVEDYFIQPGVENTVECLCLLYESLVPEAKPFAKRNEFSNPDFVRRILKSVSRLLTGLVKLEVEWKSYERCKQPSLVPKMEVFNVDNQ